MRLRPSGIFPRILATLDPSSSRYRRALAAAPTRAWHRGMVASLLLAQSLSLPAQELWTGNIDNDWSKAGNWSGGVPDAGDDVIFGTPVPGTGALISLGSGSVANSLWVQDDYTFEDGDLSLASGVIRIDFARAVQLSAELAGDAGLTLTGGGLLRLTHNLNSFTGPIHIFSGALVISDPAQLGAGSGAIGVSAGNPIAGSTLLPGFNGGSLVLDGTGGAMTLGRDLNLEGRGVFGDKTGALISLGSNILTGTIATSVSTATPGTVRNTRLLVTNGTLTLSGHLQTGSTNQGTNFTTLGGLNTAGVGNYRLAGELSGLAYLEKAGAGTLYYNPALTANFNGRLRISGSAAIGGSSVLVTSATDSAGNNIFGRANFINDAAPVDMNGGVLEIRSDQSLNFAKNVYGRASSVYFTGPGIGSAGSVNQTASFGLFRLVTNTTHTFRSRNGYGFSFGDWTAQSVNNNNTMTNEMGGTLHFTGNAWNNTDGTARTLTFGGNGNSIINGSVLASGAAHNLTKTGTGSLTIRGVSSTLNGALNVNGGGVILTDFRSINNASSNPINIGTGGTAGALIIGTGETADAAGLVSNRPINIAGTTGAARIFASQPGDNPVVINTINTTGAGAKTLILGGTNTSDNLLAGVVADNGGATTLRKDGPGTWLLTGANTYTGTTQITNGTLRLLDTYSGSSRNLIPNGSALTFTNDGISAAGGVFEYIGADGSPSLEALGSLTPTVGLGTVRVTPGAGGDATLTFTGFGTFDARSAINFIVPDGGVIRVLNQSGYNANRSFFNGADFAFFDFGGLVRAPAYGVDPFFSSPNALVEGNHGFLSASASLAGHLTQRTLKMEGDVTLTLNGGAGIGLTLNGNGVNAAGNILATGGASVINGSGAVSAGIAVLGLRVNEAVDSLTINNPLIGTGGFNKTGAGTLVLNSANAITGAITLLEGTVVLGSAARLGGDGLFNFNTFRIHGVDTVLDLGGNSIGVMHLNGNGRITNHGAAPAVFTAGHGGGDGVFSGVLEDGAGQLGFTKTGNATITLTSRGNTYTGPTAIGGSGLLSVDVMADIGQDSSIGRGDATDDASNAASLVFTGSNGGLAYTGALRNGDLTLGATSASTDRLFTLAGTGARLEGNAANFNAIVWSNHGDIVHAVSGPQLITFGGSGQGDNTFNPRLTDSGIGANVTSLLKTGVSVWVLGNANNTYSGATTIQQGILVAQDGQGLSANSNLVFDGGTLQSQGAFHRNIGFGPGEMQFAAPLPNTAKFSGGFSAGDEKLTVTWDGTPVWGSTPGFLDNRNGLIFNGAQGTTAISLNEVELASDFSLGTADGLSTSSLVYDSVNGSATVTIPAGTADLRVGQSISGPNLASGAYIIAVLNGFQVQMSANSTATAVGNTGGVVAGGSLRPIRVDDNANSGADSATLSGAISADDSLTGIRKLGGGLLRLTGDNTYSGETNVNQGALGVMSLGHSDDALNTPTSVGLSGVTFDDSNAITIGNGGTGGAILLYLGAGETSDRKIRINATTGSAQIHADGSGPLVLENVVNDMVGGAKTLFLRGASPYTNMITSVLADNGGALNVTVDGSTAWVLAGANTHSGLTSANAGALGIGHNDALGSSILSMSNGNIFAHDGDRTISNVLRLANNTTNGVFGAYSITFTGNTEILNAANDTTLVNNLAAGKTLTLGNVIPTANLTANRTWLFSGTGHTVVAGDIAVPTGTGSFNIHLSYNGNGLLELGGANLATVGSGTGAGAGANTTLNNVNGTLRLFDNGLVGTGNLVVAAGTMLIDNTLNQQVATFSQSGGAAGTFSLVNIGAGGTLSPAGYTYSTTTVQTAVATGAGTLNVGSGTFIASVVNSTTAGVVVDAVWSMDNLTGSGILDKTSTGTLNLSGILNNSFTGTYRVAEGALVVSPAAIATNSNSLVFNTHATALVGGTFEGAGSLALNTGAGAGQLQWLTNAHGGFSALDGPFTVTLNGGSPLIFGSTAGFLSGTGTLRMGSTSANDVATLTNDIDVGNTGTYLREAVTLTNGSATLTVADASNLTVGQPVLGLGIAAGATISSIVGNTITLSANANQSGARTISFLPIIRFQAIDNTFTADDKNVLSGDITGGSFNKTGNGILELGGANDFASIYVTQGTLQFSAPVSNVGELALSPLGSGNTPIALGGGLLGYGGAANFTFDRPISTIAVNSGLAANGTGVIEFAGPITIDNLANTAGTAAVNGNNLVLTSTNGGAGVISGGVTMTGIEADMVQTGGDWTLTGLPVIMGDDFVVNSTASQSILRLAATNVLQRTSAATGNTDPRLFVRGNSILEIEADNPLGTTEFTANNNGTLRGITLADGTNAGTTVMNLNGHEVTLYRLDVGATADGFTGIVNGPGTLVFNQTVANNVDNGLRMGRGEIHADITGSAFIFKFGLGDFLLTGNNTGLTQSGTLNQISRLDAGRLILDYTLSNTNKVPSNRGFDMRGGELVLLGNDLDPTTQLVTNLNLNSGGNNIISLVSGAGGQEVTLVFNAAFNRAVQTGASFNNNGTFRGTIRFNLPENGSIISNTTGISGITGLLGSDAGNNAAAYATVREFNGDTWFATRDGLANIVGLISTEANDVTTWTAGMHVTDGPGGFSGVRDSISINSLRFNDAAGSQLQVANGALLRIASGGILVTDQVTAPGAGIFGGVLLPNAGVNEIIATVDTTVPFTISSQIPNIGPSGATNANANGVTKTGPGSLHLAGYNTYSGPTNLQNGVIQVSGGNAIGDNSLVRLEDDRVSVLELLDHETIGRLLGGSNAVGLRHLATVNLNQHTLTLNTNGGDGSYNNTYGGLFTGSGTLVKDGAFNQILNNDSQGFFGHVVVNNGLLFLDSIGRLLNAATYTVNRGGELLNDQDQGSSQDKFHNNAAIYLNNTAGLNAAGVNASRGLWFRNENQDGTREDTVAAVILTAGHNVIQITSNGGTSASRIGSLIVTNFSRENYATTLVRGQNFGAASGQRNRIRPQNSLATHQIGGGGAADSTTISILPWVIGYTAASATSDAALGVRNGDTLVTWVNTTDGLRPLSFSEYATYATAGATNNTRETLNADLTGLLGRTLNSLVINNEAVPTLTVSGAGAGQKLLNQSGAFLFSYTSSDVNAAYETTLDGFDDGIEVGTSNEYLFYTVTQQSGGVLTGGATTTGNATVTVASTANLVVGQRVLGPNIPFGATIVDVLSATQFLLSVNATAAATGQTFTHETHGTHTVTIDSPLISHADLTKSGNGTLVLTAANTAGGGRNRTTLNEGTLVISSLANIGGGSGVLAFAGGALRLAPDYSGEDLSQRQILLHTGGGIFDFGDHDLVFANGIGGGGQGGFTKLGAGTLTLNGTADYRGATRIEQGSVILGAHNAVTGGDLSVLGGATLDLGGHVVHVGKVSTSGFAPQLNGSGSIVASGGFHFNHTGDLTLNAGLYGTGALEKSGTGTGTTMTVNGPVNLSGPVILHRDSGAFLIADSLTASLVSVYANATLGGVGTIYGDVMLLGGSSGNAPELIPGLPGVTSGIEEFRIEGSLSIGDFSSLTFNLGATNYTSIYAQTFASLGSNLFAFINLDFGYDPTEGSSFQLFSWDLLGDGVSSSVLETLIANNLPALSGGKTWSTELGANGLTVTVSGDGVPVAILVHPQPAFQVVEEGELVTYSVTVNEGVASDPILYQWLKDGDEIPGAISATFQIPSAAWEDSASYQVRVTNPYDEVVSDPAVLFVSALPVITQHPQNASAVEGGSHQFQVVATGPGPFTYVWFKDDLEISDSDSDTLLLTDLTPADAGEYRVEVSNTIGTAESDPATLIVGQLGVIAEEPASQTVPEGNAAVFTVVVEGGGSLTYQWQRIVGGVPVAIVDDEQFAGAGTDTLEVMVSFATQGQYRVVITPTIGGVLTSEIAQLHVGPAAITFTQQPDHQLLALGDDFTLSIATNGGRPQTFQWRRNGANASGENVAGAATETLAVYGVTLADAGLYTCVASNNLASGSSSATSDPAYVVVVDTNPRRLPVRSGTSAVLTAITAGPAGGIAYQWLKDGEPVLGANSRTYTLPSNLAAGRHIYTCRLSTLAGSMDAGANEVLVYTSAPQFGTVPGGQLPATTVGAWYDYALPLAESSPGVEDATKAAARFTMKGAPRGLAIDNNGRITGRALAAGSFTLTITASNAFAPAASLVVTLQVGELDGNLIGDFTGPIDRHPLNDNLGGVINVKVTKTGAYTARVTMGTRTFSGKGPLGISDDPQNPVTTIAVKRAKLTPLLVTFAISAASKTIVYADSHVRSIDTPGQAQINGWLNTWSKTNLATAYAGYYTAGLNIQDGDSALIPQGTGYLSFTVNATTGRLTVSGRLADNSAFTTATYVGPQGQVLVFRTLYAASARGSVLGHFVIDPQVPGNPTDNTIADGPDGGLSWRRPADPSPKARVYKAGFEELLEVVGGHYVAPVAGTAVMGIDGSVPVGTANAVVQMLEANVNDAVLGLPLVAGANPELGQVAVHVSGANKVTVPGVPALSNPRAVSATINTKTGLVTIKFTLNQPNPVLGGKPTAIKRVVTILAMIVTDENGTQALGYFLLPQLPTQAQPNNALTPIQSGQGSLAPLP